MNRVEMMFVVMGTAWRDRARRRAVLPRMAAIMMILW